MERAELKMRVEELEAEVAELKNIIELLRIVIKNNESKIALLEKHKEDWIALLHTAIEIMGGNSDSLIELHRVFGLSPIEEVWSPRVLY
ncbi:hypothetical protein AgCh_005911 [Apium graveolens]